MQNDKFYNSCPEKVEKMAKSGYIKQHRLLLYCFNR